MAVADRAIRAIPELKNRLADVFRKAGWRVRRPSSAQDKGVDLILEREGTTYVFELKAASEGRRDRLIPLLSQAVLEVQAAARRFPDRVIPVAVIAAPRVPVSVAEQVKEFAGRYASDVGIGVIDAEGLRLFAGPGLEGLDAKPRRRLSSTTLLPQRLPDLFSDLNQWMLKILVGQRLPESLLNVPRGAIRNASHLAEIADVSVMSASRFVNQLRSRGLLDEGAEHLSIVRVEDLLELWISGNRDSSKEVPARWIIKGGKDQLRTALKEYTSRPMHNQPTCCLGLFAAADALGFGFVQGAPAHIYLDRLTLDALNRLGLAVDHSNHPAEVIIRIPANRAAIFRAAVTRGGVPVSDVLQVWLDVSTHPVRGREQAREIRRRALGVLFDRSK